MQRNENDNISIVTLLRQNGSIFNIPVVCSISEEIRLNKNREIGLPFSEKFLSNLLTSNILTQHKKRFDDKCEFRD